MKKTIIVTITIMFVVSAALLILGAGILALSPPYLGENFVYWVNATTGDNEFLDFLVSQPPLDEFLSWLRSRDIRM